MLYHIRVDGRPDGADLQDAGLRDFADIVVVTTEHDTVLSCRVPDAAALTGIVAFLHDLGLVITEMSAVPDSDTA